METVRKPFQGVWNIVRFNWHFYFLIIALLVLVFTIGVRVNYQVGIVIAILAISITLITLIVSFYVYDLSGIYDLNWLDQLSLPPKSVIFNFSAGFDETSVLIKKKFPLAELNAFDFYDPVTHTEISIKRARKAYPPFPGTSQVVSSSLPSGAASADIVFVIFAAHEIRKEMERDVFFNELKRILKPDGKIVVTEHLRDLPNFLAYTIGFFHFMPLSSWRRTFKKCSLNVSDEFKITPFVSTFILERHGAAS